MVSLLVLLICGERNIHDHNHVHQISVDQMLSLIDLAQHREQFVVMERMDTICNLNALDKQDDKNIFVHESILRVIIYEFEITHIIHELQHQQNGIMLTNR